MKSLFLVTVLLALGSIVSYATPLAVGAAAPAVTGTDQNGKSIDFAKAYKKGLTLVYFYPKAGTPGCTAQACSLRDSFADLTAQGIQVIGVSRDSVASQKKFEESNKLPFPLVADADGKVAAAFGVDLIPVVGLTQRESFLIKDGKIAWVTTKAQTSTHAQEVRDAVAKLK
ncbi:peroxiredoxin [soil metagenome]